MRDILFMGAILASVTHEMQNVMAIIKESGALADDILQINGSPKLKHGDKLSAALGNVQKQVARGRDLMLMLNGFAHAASDYPERCDMLRFARQISVLAERAVRLKECHMETSLDEGPVFVRGNALILMQSIYLGIESLLQCCRAGDTVIVLADKTRREPAGRAYLLLRTRSDAVVPQTALVEPAMRELDGFCHGSPGCLELCFTLADEPVQEIRP